MGRDMISYIILLIVIIIEAILTAILSRYRSNSDSLKKVDILLGLTVTLSFLAVMIIILPELSTVIHLFAT
jgi:hypothetical protein